jgi:MFS family permease
VAIACFVFFYRLNKLKSNEKVIYYAKYFFLLMGIATTWGGIIGHMFLYVFEDGKAWKVPGWVISMLSIMLMERVAIEHNRVLLSKKIINVLRVVNVIEFLLFLFLAMYYLNFSFVEAHSAYGLMVVVMTLEAILYYKMKNDASKFMLWGVGLAAIAAVIFTFDLSPHPWFNHMALSHMFMLAATWFFFRGVTKIDMSDAKAAKED